MENQEKTSKLNQEISRTPYVLNNAWYVPCHTNNEIREVLNDTIASQKACLRKVVGKVLDEYQSQLRVFVDSVLHCFRDHTGPSHTYKNALDSHMYISRSSHRPMPFLALINVVILGSSLSTKDAQNMH